MIETEHVFFIDVARTMLLREACSAFVVERSILPLIEQNRVQRVPEAPSMTRPAHAICPARPTHFEVQEIALTGLRGIAARIIGNGAR